VSEKLNRFSEKLSEGRHSSDLYGSNKSYQDHLIAQYTLYVEMADRISSRRQTANSFFLSINTAIFAFVSYGQSENNSLRDAEMQFVVAIAGVILCFTWYRLVRSYRDLNTAKFKVIHEIERRLPLSPYDAEWEAVGGGDDSKLYLPFTHVEKFIPWIFMALHGFAFAIGVRWSAVVTKLLGFIASI
jgi:hypothetical protein